MGGVRFGSRLIDTRVVRLAISPEEAFKRIRRIGGGTGWYFGVWLWNLRGFGTGTWEELECVEAAATRNRCALEIP